MPHEEKLENIARQVDEKFEEKAMPIIEDGTLIVDIEEYGGIVSDAKSIADNVSSFLEQKGLDTRIEKFNDDPVVYHVHANL